MITSNSVPILDQYPVIKSIWYLSNFKASLLLCFNRAHGSDEIGHRNCFLNSTSVTEGKFHSNFCESFLITTAAHFTILLTFSLLLQHSPSFHYRTALDLFKKSYAPVPPNCTASDMPILRHQEHQTILRLEFHLVIGLSGEKNAASFRRSFCFFSSHRSS